jgi:transcriptional regulator with XRE-family HTH domain
VLVFDGRRLRDQRRLAGISAAQLAAQLGRSEWAVYSWETGRTEPPVTVAAAAAAALALPLETLLLKLDDPNAVAA